MKKILFTSNVSWAMIKFRYGLLKHLIKNGYEVYIVAPHDDFVPQLKNMGCKCINIQLNRKGINPFEDLKLLLKLYNIYKEIKPDIIFNYSIKPIIYGSVAAKLAGIKSVAVNIGLGYTFINTNIVTRISHMLYRFALYFPVQVWFINEDDRDDFVKLNLVRRDKTLVLPSEGIDIEYFSPKKSTNTGIVFLLIARMLWDKGIKEFYEAAKLIKNKFPDVKFQLLGNIDLENPKGMTKDILDGWHDEGAIEYLGYSKDVRHYISDATCIVLPSYREGKGMTLIEAGAMEKPLIATNVPGCKDIVKNGYNGFLCEVKNSQSLADSIEKFILLDENIKLKFGENSKIFMKENFDEEIVIKIYENFLNKELS